MQQLNKDFQDIFNAIKIVNPAYTNSRDLYNVYSRVIIANYLRDLGYSQIAIGKLIGRDHSSVNHYQESFKNLMKYTRDFQDFHKEVMKNFKKEEIVEEIENPLSKFTIEELQQELLRRQKTNETN